MQPEDSVGSFIQEFGEDLLAVCGFDEKCVLGVREQGLGVDLTTGDVVLYVLLKGDPGGKPLQLVEAPFFNPKWSETESVEALGCHLGLSPEEASARLARAGICRVENG
jgi:hypothetical protein